MAKRRHCHGKDTITTTTINLFRRMTTVVALSPTAASEEDDSHFNTAFPAAIDTYAATTVAAAVTIAFAAVIAASLPSQLLSSLSLLAGVCVGKRSYWHDAGRRNIGRHKKMSPTCRDDISDMSATDKNVCPLRGEADRHKSQHCQPRQRQCNYKAATRRQGCEGNQLWHHRWQGTRDSFYGRRHLRYVHCLTYLR